MINKNLLYIYANNYYIVMRVSGSEWESRWENRWESEWESEWESRWESEWESEWEREGRYRDTN